MNGYKITLDDRTIRLRHEDEDGGAALDRTIERIYGKRAWAKGRNDGSPGWVNRYELGEQVYRGYVDIYKSDAKGSWSNLVDSHVWVEVTPPVYTN